MKSNDTIFDMTISTVKNGDIVQKKIGIYSQKTSILLRYMQLSKPKFSRATAAKEKLFELMADNHPDVWARILEELPIKKREYDGKIESHWAGNKTHLTNPVSSILDAACKETETNESRIITIYSPQLAAMFKYLDNTTIRFRTSAYGAELLEEKFEIEYPVIWAQICKRVGFS